MKGTELNEYIEDRSLYCIRQYLTPKISDFMGNASTKPTWDGSLIYRTYPGKKEDIIEIPVQVKGSFDVNIYDNDKAPVSVEDLKNYRYNGVLYFFVKMKIDRDYNVISNRVLYTILFHNDIDEILSLLKNKNQKNVTIEFKEINNKNDFELVCEIFKQKKLMLNESTQLLSTINMNKISEITILNDTKSNIPIFGHKYFGQVKSESGKYYIDNLRVEEIVLSKQNNVYVGDTLYFDKTKIIRKENKLIIELNQALQFVIEKSGVRIKLTFASNIYSFRDALKFIGAAILQESFVINSKSIPFVNINDDFFEYDNISKLLQKCEYITLFLDKTKCNKEYQFNDFTASQIDSIVNIFSKDTTEIRPFFIELKYSAIAFASGMKNNAFEIYNIFDDDFLCNFWFAIQDDEGNYSRTLPYTILRLEHLIKIDFIDLEKYKIQFSKYVELSDATARDLNNFSLRLLSAYDINNNKNLLEIAYFNFKKLNERYPDVDIYLINIIQCMIRLEESIVEYYEFIDGLTKSENNDLKFCGHVLFKNEYYASKIKVSEDIKETPIYNLYNYIKKKTK